MHINAFRPCRAPQSELKYDKHRHAHPGHIEKDPRSRTATHLLKYTKHAVQFGLAASSHSSHWHSVNENYASMHLIIIPFKAVKKPVRKTSQGSSLKPETWQMPRNCMDRCIIFIAMACTFHSNGMHCCTHIPIITSSSLSFSGTLHVCRTRSTPAANLSSFQGTRPSEATIARSAEDVMRCGESVVGVRAVMKSCKTSTSAKTLHSKPFYEVTKNI
eukprot:6178935-Pleurochrysis_carterae.AAC.3